MTKLLPRTLSVIAWLSVASLVYIGVVFLFVGPMMGPRGDIDYVAFSEAEKQAADNQAFWTSVFGLVPLTMAGVIVWGRERAVRWAVAMLEQPGRGPTQPTVP